MRINLNQNWMYTDTFNEDFLKYGTGGTEVVIPHSTSITPFHHWGPEEYERISGYRLVIQPEEAWKGKNWQICFEAAAHGAEIFFNGKLVKTHGCGYTAFSVDITDLLEYGKENILAVKLNSFENQNIPPYGFVIDYMTYGGIYRNVWLEIRNPVYMEDVFFTGADQGEFRCEIALNQEIEQGEARILVSTRTGEKCYEDKMAISGQSAVISGKVPGIAAWSVEKPTLYQVEVVIATEGTEDRRQILTGFRTMEFLEDGFYLNHRKLKLRGLNRHQSYPYVGYAMPDSVQREDADILKRELGVNMVRTSHYPQSHAFVERCDELGILVFTEIPGWQHIGDDAWKDQAVENVKEMILEYRNHPSIALWGVRINESQDDDDFYRRTNALAHRLDPTRATTGVRFIEKSNLLEDVYAFNDFSHTGNNPGLKPKKKVTSDVKKAYMVSECNGHMYPTKAFDSEEHRLSHALRHAAVLESMYAAEDIAGVLTWCMFDYNTHKDFGSGDGICYHGVMDMFRNPKLAAAVYASQQDETPVCEVSSSMDIGEHPAGNIGDIVVFTNADSVKLFKRGQFVKEFFPDQKTYGHLPHPPVIIDDLVGELLEKNETYSAGLAAQIKSCLLAVGKYGQGNLPLKYMLKFAYLMIFRHVTFDDGVRLFGKYIGNWGGEAPEYRFEAIKNGKTVKVITRQQGRKLQLEAKAATDTLTHTNGYDAAIVRIRMVDDLGNQAPYYQEPLSLRTEGGIEILGPTIISLKGGMGGTLVKTNGLESEGRLYIESADYGTVTLHFNIE